MELLNQLDKYSGYVRSSKTFPYFAFKDTDDSLAVLIENLPEGDMPLVVLIDGRAIRVALFKCTPLVINDILKVTEILYCKSNEEVYVISDIEQLLDMEDMKWTKQ